MSGIECAFFGTLGRDAGLKTSKAGKSYVRVSVRVGDGEGAQWVSVLGFDDAAVDGVAKLTTGARVYVEGTLKLETWENAAGVERRGLTCFSRHLRLAAIGRNAPQREPRETKPAAASPSSRDDFPSDEIPF